MILFFIGFASGIVFLFLFAYIGVTIQKRKIKNNNLPIQLLKKELKKKPKRGNEQLHKKNSMVETLIDELPFNPFDEKGVKK